MKKNPNIIVITTDQQRLDSLSCTGSKFIKTPNLDRLASEGALMTRAYCCNPVCTPARASLFSGMNVSRHGAWNVGTKIPEDLKLLSHRLSDIGYRTHNIGKMHFQPYGDSDSEECIDDWNDGKSLTTKNYYGFQTLELACGHTAYGMTGAYGEWILDQIDGDRDLFKSFKTCTSAYKGKDTEAKGALDIEQPAVFQNSVWTAERSCAFLREQDPDKPFFLSIGFQDPHHPHAVPKDCENRVDPNSVLLPDYIEGELEDKPPHFIAALQGKLNEQFSGEYRVAGAGPDKNYTGLSEEFVRLNRSYYYTLVQNMDEQLGKILNCLDELDLTDNTLLVFTTDHGELLGDHGLWFKGPFHYEELVNVPMIIRWPAGFMSGLRSDALISHIDIVQTIMTAVGHPCEENQIDGIDMGPVLRGESKNVRDHVLIECIDNPTQLRLKTIVTDNQKCTRYAGCDYGELYDLNSDPKEKQNHWNNPEYASKKADLLNLILNDIETNERREKRYCLA